MIFDRDDENFQQMDVDVSGSHPTPFAVATDFYCPPLLSHFGVVECCKNVSGRNVAAHEALIRFTGNQNITHDFVENSDHVYDYITKGIIQKIVENPKTDTNSITTHGLYANRQECLDVLGDIFTEDLIKIASPWHEWCVETVRFVETGKNRPFLYNIDKNLTDLEKQQLQSDEEDHFAFRNFIQTALFNTKTVQQLYAFLNEAGIFLDVLLPLLNWPTTSTAVNVLKEVIVGISNLLLSGYSGSTLRDEIVKQAFESLNNFDETKTTAEIVIEMALLLSKLFSKGLFSEANLFTLAPRVQILLLWFTVKDNTSLIALECTPSHIYDLRHKMKDPLLTATITNDITQLASKALPVDANTLNKLYEATQEKDLSRTTVLQSLHSAFAPETVFHTGAKSPVIGKVYENNPFLAMDNHWYPLSTFYIKNACGNANITELWESYQAHPTNQQWVSEYVDPQITISLAGLRGAKCAPYYFPVAVINQTDDEYVSAYRFIDGIGLNAFDGEIYVMNDVCGSVIVDDNYEFKLDAAHGWYSTCVTNLFPYIDKRCTITPTQIQTINEYSLAIAEHNYFFYSDDATVFMARVGKRRQTTENVEYLSLPVDTVLFLQKLPSKAASTVRAKIHLTAPSAESSKKSNISSTGSSKSSSPKHEAATTPKDRYGLCIPPILENGNDPSTSTKTTTINEFNLEEDFLLSLDSVSKRAFTFKTETLFDKTVTNEDIIFLSAANRYTEVLLSLISLNVVKFPNTVKDVLLKTAYNNATLFGSAAETTDAARAREIVHKIVIRALTQPSIIQKITQGKHLCEEFRKSLTIEV